MPISSCARIENRAANGQRPADPHHFPSQEEGPWVASSRALSITKLVRRRAVDRFKRVAAHTKLCSRNPRAERSPRTSSSPTRTTGALAGLERRVRNPVSRSRHRPSVVPYDRRKRAHAVAVTEFHRRCDAFGRSAEPDPALATVRQLRPRSRRLHRFSLSPPIRAFAADRRHHGDSAALARTWPAAAAADAVLDPGFRRGAGPVQVERAVRRRLGEASDYQRRSILARIVGREQAFSWDG